MKTPVFEDESCSDSLGQCVEDFSEVGLIILHLLFPDEYLRKPKHDDIVDSEEHRNML